MLYCVILYCIALHYTALYCIALCCIVLYCNIMHCIALYCIVIFKVKSDVMLSRQSYTINTYFLFGQKCERTVENLYNKYNYRLMLFFVCIWQFVIYQQRISLTFSRCWRQIRSDVSVLFRTHPTRPGVSRATPPAPFKLRLPFMTSRLRPPKSGAGFCL